MIIAVDFDGTIVEHRYPEIGKEIPFAIETLKMLQREGHRLILWSVREDKLLEEAVEFCRQRGLEFYAVNTNYPEEKSGHEHFSRKLKADVFIDDRNLGGLFDWGSIYRIIHTVRLTGVRIQKKLFHWRRVRTGNSFFYVGSRRGLFHVEHQSLEVFAFGMVDVDRMVAGLRELVKDAHAASALGGGGEHGIAEVLLADYL